ncbi:metal ABC transporter ATP-binding protein [Rhodalgimonas zhirmunskyi]|uniref:Metal ABC transporter ATP-binding protein n=1 Tax=Rhodalgimonas zhirmunskyi TaxID=2964767 RepID=A0AAJ1X5Y3_9RHOB|nr:metal ABC transporter ATP-binding protein [Rhodoalgimonas zhirmunskyi]MDQ2094624.1 metal ABC transporter ATP-binding protein [Rhodoalgimonas zhirmunskyi]
MSGTPKRLVTLEHIDVTLGHAQVLSHVDFHIDAGEIVTIVGPNGSGKTTLLRSILGALTPSAGRITRAPGLRIGYVPQKLHIDPTLPLTVRRFLSLPRRVSDTDAAQALEQAGVAALSGRQISGLSGGQFQRVLLARALLTDPELLILDEATQGLDQPGSAAFYQKIEEVRRDLGCAVLMVSHELHVVMAASDRVICLNGHVCCHGAPEHVASAPEYRALFGSGTHGALALYRHDHNHRHEEDGAEAQDDCGPGCTHDHTHTHTHVAKESAQ